MKLLSLLILSISLLSCSQSKEDGKNSTDSISNAIDTNLAVNPSAQRPIVADGYRIEGDSMLLPPFTIRLQLSAAAEEKLKATNETIIVSADFQGIPKDTTIAFYQKWGYVVVGEYPIELKDARTAQFDRVKISKAGYDSLGNKDLTVSINVFSGRHSSENNLLDCDYLEEPLSKVRKQPNVLSGKLIGE